MADEVVNKKQALLDNTVINNLVDNQFIELMHELPNPDVILRKANIDEAVYQEILADAHVIGEVRPLRSALLGYQYEIKAGDESAPAQKALELCEGLFESRPHTTMSWSDLHWSFGQAPLVGRRVHSVTWDKVGKYILPEGISDISTLSYAFNHEGELLLRTKENPQGELAEEYRWIVTRHMSTKQNPYGVALLSTCFWPWMFKNGGFKFFVKFCEKFGIPWPMAKYPEGTPTDKIKELVERLQAMVEDAVGALPEGNEINLLEAKSTGEGPSERLINLCNREISKAITSQTLATEIQGQGSRAAAETHQGRTDTNGKADRELVAQSYNELFEWITLVNLGPNVPAPKFTWIDKKERKTSDVQYYADAARLIPIKKSEIYKGLDISEPGEGDDVVFLGGNNADEQNDDDENQGPQFRANFSEQEQFREEDQAISDIVDQVKKAIDDGATLQEALDNIAALIPDLERNAFDEIVRNQLELEYGVGMLEAE